MTNPQVFDLPALPPTLPSFVKAGLSASRRPKGTPVLPDWQVRVRALRVDRARLNAYSALCGLPESPELPILYPQVLATPLFLNLMTRPGFPLPLLGLVHVRNDVAQQRPLRVDETFDLSIRIGEGREVKAGFEFDLIMEATPVESEPVWRATMTVIHRGPKQPSKGLSRSKAPSSVVDARLSEYLALSAPEDTGRRYAAVSQDYNPIHLYSLTAKLFGFPRAIGHGLWSAARCLALLQDRLGAAPKAYSVQFKQPLLLPGRAALRYAVEGGVIDFSLLSASSDKVHLSGTLR
ncbi:MaoC/PaaZ C-terminal domain-containing protein [Nevskia soli]|uniref:MaoC/PaaZ C-terminal domain-containing protein n=1 Tax=Nevskia soli TaxID=418856 RepID=UPI0004A6BA22|nr:MaoC/PaaZ C-terminal domain-containing protein [Nevskia soli]